ncbi:hypothetical protein ACLOJK_000219 [Asimina triloba]
MMLGIDGCCCRDQAARMPIDSVVGPHDGDVAKNRWTARFGTECYRIWNRVLPNLEQSPAEEDEAIDAAPLLLLCSPEKMSC